LNTPGVAAPLTVHSDEQNFSDLIVIVKSSENWWHLWRMALCDTVHLRGGGKVQRRAEECYW